VDIGHRVVAHPRVGKSLNFIMLQTTYVVVPWCAMTTMGEAGASGDLPGLLAGAEGAGPADRIEWRDRIAAFGAPAISAVAPWLADARLAAFAIRVIERAGRDGEREAAVAALRRARHRVDPRVRPDLDRALLGLRLPRRTR
jgi:hypothetical protein